MRKLLLLIFLAGQVFAQVTSGLHSSTVTSSTGLKLKPYGPSVGNVTEIRFYELSSSGLNYFGWKAPSYIAAGKVYVMPRPGTAGQLLTYGLADSTYWSDNVWTKPTSGRLQPTTLSDTVRVNKLRVGTASTAGYVLTMDADGNAAPAAVASSAFDPATTWNLFEEFVFSPGVSNSGIGELGWVFTPTNSGAFGFGGNTGSANNPSDFQFNNNAANREGSLGSPSGILLQAGSFFQFRVLLETVAAANDMRFCGGFGDQTSYGSWFTAGDAAFFNFDPDSSANWRIACVSNGTKKITTTSSAVSALTWYVLRGTVNATADSMQFRVGTSSSSLSYVGSVAGVPTGAGRHTGPRLQAMVGSGGGGGSGYIYIDYYWTGGTISR